MSSSIASTTTVLLPVRAEATTQSRQKNPSHTKVVASSSRQNAIDRRKLVTAFVTTSVGLAIRPEASLAEKWGTRSFLLERFFQPGLSPEDAAARIRQTAEGLHSLREMVDLMAWRYIIFYIRLKQSYLGQDLKTVMSTVPESRRAEYVETANELVHNMSKFDDFVRTPKVYESYLYYEATLKSIDKVVALL